MTSNKRTFAIYVITKHGLGIAEKVMQALPDCDLYVSERLFDSAPAVAIKMPLPMGPTLRETWKQYDCHIHAISIGAVVRMTKDFMESKKVDPAVVCIDDAARFAICVLSGHVGRGNLYTEQIAQAIGALPVITTASDSIGTLSVDILGRGLGWFLDDPERNLTKAASDVVNSFRVAFIQETGEPDFWPLNKSLPDGIEYFTSLEQVDPNDFESLLIVTDREFEETHKAHWDKAVIYRPKSLVLGLGCDRDAPLDVVETGILTRLKEQSLSPKCIKAFVSVDQKADEIALIQLSEKYNIPFITYSGAELDVVEGIENPSDVVKKYVGTRSVAEAACLLHSGATKLLMPKTPFKKEDGGKNMTCAIARVPFPKRS